MATAKQIAWRKKFAAMAKAGKFSKATTKPVRKVNPARKVAAKKPSMKHRKIAVVRRRNPVLEYTVKMGTKTSMRTVARCETAAGAKAYAKQLHREHPASHIGVYKD